MKVNIVWFKKDLRIEDNEAIFLAAKENLPIILIYIFEEELIKQDDFSYRHFKFLSESLSDLIKNCKKNNLNLNLKIGDSCEIFSEILQKFTINKIFSHQETGNYSSFQRDLKVKKFCQTNKIKWIEACQFGVIRKLKDRDGWANLWFKQMTKPVLSLEKNIESIKISGLKNLPSAQDFNLEYDGIKNPQIGGRENGLKILNDFLYLRGENYSKEMSSPVTAFDSCSRISPYLTFGSLSIKEVFQIASKRQDEIKSMKIKGKWPSALRSFLGRLRWHCHFIQKLEDEPRIEFENLHKAYDNIERDRNLEYFEAWKNGETGFPMIDASMRALIETGWINFRMRAMLVSFASNNLWLDWRLTAKYLARMFVDYEPGIHYSQIQMQSGTTGINAIRIYSATKQAKDQDPQGIFIKKYIPELRDVSAKNIATPWNEPLLMNGYKMTIVDENQSRKEAAKKLYNIRKNLSFKEESKKIVKKHGSRKSGLKKTVKQN